MCVWAVNEQSEVWDDWYVKGWESERKSPSPDMPSVVRVRTSSQMALNGGVTVWRVISLSLEILAKVMYSPSETESWCILFNRKSDGRWPWEDQISAFVLLWIS